MDKFQVSQITSKIRNVPDFPKKGIQFKDLTTVFKDPELMQLIVRDLSDHYGSLGVTKIAGIESRGFIVGAALGVKLGVGFIPVRKPGKLPAKSYRKEYFLEYGSDALEVHADAFEPNDVVLIHDDLLATGGTARAAYELVSMFGVKKVYLNFIVELSFLNGRSRFDKETEIYSLISYQD